MGCLNVFNGMFKCIQFVCEIPFNIERNALNDMQNEKRYSFFENEDDRMNLKFTLPDRRCKRSGVSSHSKTLRAVQIRCDNKLYSI
jgi:hypothetical protein